MTSPRAAGLVTIFAENGAADLGLERHGVVLAAVVADDLKTCRRVFARRRFFRTALCTPLRRHHVTLVKLLLLFLGENKDLAALNTRYFCIGHRGTP